MYRKIKRLLDSELGQDVLLQIPKDPKMGHFATPIALMLAKKEKQSPQIIAQKIIQKLESNPAFASLSEKNGFINIFISDEFLAQSMKNSLQNPQDFARGDMDERGDFARGDMDARGGLDFARDSKNLQNASHENLTHAAKKQKILLEFVSANPTGPLHIGHARGAIFGDILARIGAHLGHAITKEYYINDAGSQIDLLGLSVYIAGRENLGLEVNYPEVFYRGEYLNKIARDAQKEFGDSVFGAQNPSNANPTNANLAPDSNARDSSAPDSKDSKDSKNSARNQTPDSKNIPDSEILLKLARFALPFIMDDIINTLRVARIEIDSFMSEESLKNELANMLEKLQKNDAIYESEGKLWLKSSAKGDQKDRVILRDSGQPTYLAGDIIYHNNKFLRDFDKYINIWGADHHGYIARIKASVEFLGFDAKKLEVILSQMVSLLKNGAPFKMSKRAGNVILMRDVMDEIGVDEMRFMFISKRADTHLEFDVEMFKKEDANNPIYYINYANARIHTLLSKSRAQGSFDISACENEWKDLLLYAFLLPKILDSAFSERALQQLPEYLKNLSAKLHFCYNSLRIIGSPNEAAIVSILRVVSLSITTGLYLMGIEAKTKMIRE